MNKKRLAGIEKQVSRLISQVLFEEVKNPKIKGLVSVTACRVTPDLKFADVSFSIMPVGNKEDFNLEKNLEGLEQNKKDAKEKERQN